MSNRILKAIASLTVMVAMTLGMLPFAEGHWLSHSPATMTAGQTARLAMAAEEHVHVHDDVDVGEQAQSHPHGHNPADHSHQTPILPAKLAGSFQACGQRWRIQSPARPILDTAFRLERPPRPILNA